MTYHINWILVNKLLVYKQISFMRKYFRGSTIWTISVDINYKVRPIHRVGAEGVMSILKGKKKAKIADCL